MQKLLIDAVEPYASSGDKFKCVEILVKYSPTHFLYNVQSYDNLTGSAKYEYTRECYFCGYARVFCRSTSKISAVVCAIT